MLVPIPVEDVATTAVETVTPTTSVREAARRLRTAAIGSLVVVEADEPVGILTESDLVGVFADAADPETPVEDVMSAPLVTVEAGQQLEAAAELACEHGVKKLPVVAEGDLVGILTTTDLSYYLPELARLRARGTDEEARELQRINRDARLDTAYEREDWTFEYEAPEGNSEAEVEVGDVARFSKTVSEEDVRAFAEATGDTNRLHLEEAFAAQTRFGGRIAHGTLVTGVISAALARLPGLTIYLSKDLHFVGPVDIGERVTAVCRVTEDLGGRKYQLSATVRDSSDEAVVSGSVTVLVDDIPDVAVGALDDSVPDSDEGGQSS